MPRFGDPGHPKGGRKTRYTKVLADAICRGIASGRPSGEVCAELGLPRQTVGEWRGAHPEFRQAYLTAFACRAVGMVEEAIEIIDSTPLNADMARVQRERARAELRRWTASRLVGAFQETSVHQHSLAGRAEIRVLLPAKGAAHDGPLLDGQAVELPPEPLIEGRAQTVAIEGGTGLEDRAKDEE
jgi:hypothetical protein